MHSVSIVVPAYNEERRLPTSLKAVLAYLAQRKFDAAEIIVVNDGSSDRTADCARLFNASGIAVRLVENGRNRGKGFSVRNGVLSATGGWILVTDADLSAPIDQLDLLLTEAEKQQAQVAIGSRALNRALIGVHQPASREYAGRVFNGAMQLVTGLPFADTQCGFKLFQADAARHIFERQQLDGFGFDVEDLFIARLLGIKTIEVPVRWNNVEGTKVSLANGLDSFADLLRIRWYQLRGKYREPSASR
ncbi:MAG: glycosyltransferase family 2 protein [Bryobacteraceae bacterium]|nr:glycosyltransferase family 2 protein [Bryobacteraceae bacterium]